MEATSTLWMCLLLNQLLLDPVEADPLLSITQTYSAKTQEHSGSLMYSVEPYVVTTDHQSFDNDSDSTRGDCLIDTEMGLIAIGSAGGLIFCLLVATIVLACQVFQLQRRVYVPRTSRLNLDLVGSTHYWGPDQTEVGGLVGPCDTNVMLEEVKVESKMKEERRAEKEEATGEVGRGLEGITGMCFDHEDKDSQIQSSSSRDLEDMPLVV
uniref:Uncharacterized protein n=2 Tax=Nothobranchius TaxID=28779 RepID=A0A1A8M6T8_9TELE